MKSHNPDEKFIVWCLIAGTLNVTVERYLLMKKTFIRGNESSYYHEQKTETRFIPKESQETFFEKIQPTKIK